MYPHERSLVKRLKDKPFVLLGVNVNDPSSRLEQLRGNGTLTWRFWLDKPPGPISSSYHVEAFPTLFLIDQKGIIRAIDVEDFQQLEADIQHLLREGDKAKTS